VSLRGCGSLPFFRRGWPYGRGQTTLAGLAHKRGLTPRYVLLTGKRRDAVRVSWIGLIGCVLLLVACGASSTGGSSAASSSAPPATATPDLAAAAATAYSAAFNTLNQGEGVDIPKQNGSDPTVSAAAINDRVRLRQAFDSAVSAITFPSGDQSDARAVLDADSALESALGTLAANTDSVSNYNGIFPTVLSAENAFKSADAAISRDLHLVNTTPTP